MYLPERTSRPLYLVQYREYTLHKHAHAIYDCKNVNFQIFFLNIILIFGQTIESMIVGTC